MFLHFRLLAMELRAVTLRSWNSMFVVSEHFPAFHASRLP